MPLPTWATLRAVLDLGLIEARSQNEVLLENLLDHVLPDGADRFRIEGGDLLALEKRRRDQPIKVDRGPREALRRPVKRSRRHEAECFVAGERWGCG